MIKIKIANQRRVLKPRNDPYYYQVRKGLHVGFRKAPGTKTETWTARARVGDGYKYTTLDSTDFEPAEDLARGWADDLKAGKGDAIKLQKQADTLTVGEVLTLYIDEFKTEKCLKVENWEIQSTRRARAYVWNREINSVPLKSLTAEHFKKLQMELRATMTAASVNRNLTGLRAALNWAYAKRWVTDTPWKQAKLLKIAPKNRRKRNKEYFSLKDRTAFLAAAEPSLKAICIAMMLTGCRPSEARRLEARDVDLAGCFVVLMTRKGDDSDLKDRRFKLAGVSLEFFRKQIEGHEPEDRIFTTRQGLPWSMDNLSKEIRSCRTRNKLSDKWESYCWRHSFIQDCINNGEAAMNVALICGTSTQYIESNYHQPDDNLAERLSAQFAGVLGA